VSKKNGTRNPQAGNAAGRTGGQVWPTHRFPIRARSLTRRAPNTLLWSVTGKALYLETVAVGALCQLIPEPLDLSAQRFVR
jgi:hypothetical protein